MARLWQFLTDSRVLAVIGIAAFAAFLVIGAESLEIAAVCAQLASYGVAARNLRAFRTAADRQSALLGQLVGHALGAQSPDRREAALDDLRTLAELAQELSQLLSWRALRQLAST